MKALQGDEYLSDEYLSDAYLGMGIVGGFVRPPSLKNTNTLF